MVEFLQPEELKSKIDFKLVDDPVPNEDLEKLAAQVIRYSVKTGKTCYISILVKFAQLFRIL